MPTPVGHLVLLQRHSQHFWMVVLRHAAHTTQPRPSDSTEQFRNNPQRRVDSTRVRNAVLGQPPARPENWPGSGCLQSGDMHASPSRLLKSCDRQACPLCRETGGRLFEEGKKKSKENPEKTKKAFSLPHRSIATRRGATPKFARLAPNRWLTRRRVGSMSLAPLVKSLAATPTKGCRDMCTIHCLTREGPLHITITTLHECWLKV